MTTYQKSNVRNRKSKIINPGEGGRLEAGDRRLRIGDCGMRIRESCKTNPICPGASGDARPTLRNKANPVAGQGPGSAEYGMRSAESRRAAGERVCETKPIQGSGIGGQVTDCAKQSQTWAGWGTWGSGHCVRGGSSTRRNLPNKANLWARGMRIAECGMRDRGRGSETKQWRRPAEGGWMSLRNKANCRGRTPDNRLGERGHSPDSAKQSQFRHSGHREPKVERAKQSQFAHRPERM